MSTTSVTIDELLQTTSRTFALSIPLLPAPLNREITLAYLVFRIADTLEDAENLDRDRRQLALRTFDEYMRFKLVPTLPTSPSSAPGNWCDDWRNVSHNEDYNRLVGETSRVLGLVGELERDAAGTILKHALRSVRGMELTLRKADVAGNLTLDTLDELREYCYYVAGIVGEMITELFLSHHDVAQIDSKEVDVLHETSAKFGEALQLVNILKDSNDDKLCGRAYLPANVPHEAIFELAQSDLREAERYVDALRRIGAAPGMIAFCDAPVQLASATLKVVAEQGPGSKVPRDETFALLQQVVERAGLGE